MFEKEFEEFDRNIKVMKIFDGVEAKEYHSMDCYKKFIKENDGLPQIICVRCLGTLEFLCDFYDDCQHTQKELLQAVQNKAEEKLQREDDAESDKENAVPSTIHKPKALLPVASKVAKNSVAKNKDSNNLHLDNNHCSSDIQPVTCTLVPLENLISNKQPTVRNVFAYENNSMNEQKHSTNFISEKDSIMKGTNSMNLLLMDETNVNENSVFPVRRKRGRKSKLEKMMEASLLKKENVVDEKNNFQNKLKRYFLRNICENVNSVTKSTVVSFKPEVKEATVKKQVAMDLSLNETCIEDRGTDIINDGAVPDEPIEMKFNDENSKKKEDNLVKSKAISVIVKQEKLEPDSMPLTQNVKLDPLAWIPSKILMQENLLDNESENQMKEQKTEVLQISSSLLRKDTKKTEKETLEAHHKKVHIQDYICKICGKRLKSKKALHNHQNVHAAGKYKCSLCPNIYKSSQILKEHILKHKGIRNYKCNVCEKTFAQQSHLAAHMAVHSKIRFHCPGCDKPFNRHDNMKVHTKRCKMCLTNPDLKNLFIKRERSSSFTKITKIDDDLGSENVSIPVSTFVESQDNELSIRTVGNQEKTALNFCKLGLNISCIEPVDKTWDRVDLYKKVTEVTSSTEINVIQITKVSDKLLPESENLTVLENVLRPESF